MAVRDYVAAFGEPLSLLRVLSCTQGFFHERMRRSRSAVRCQLAHVSAYDCLMPRVWLQWHQEAYEGTRDILISFFDLDDPDSSCSVLLISGINQKQ